MEKGVLMLSDGTCYFGNIRTKKQFAIGELCFNTSITGYQESFTDPSYKGQLLVTTTPHIGCYGYLENDNYEVESDNIKINGLICRNFEADNYSRTKAKGDILSYFNKNNKVVIENVDTRTITIHIREEGPLNALISTFKDTGKNELEDLYKKYEKKLKKEIIIENEPSLPSNSFFTSSKNLYKVALLDFGVKKNIINCLLERDCCIQTFSMKNSLKEILNWKPDGILISNGAGNPSTLKSAIKRVKDIIKTKIPTFGICMGHQLIGLALGIKIDRLKVGHRGVNHPVKNLLTNRGEITSQNCGYVLNIEDIKNKKDLEVSHINLIDNTLAGLKHKVLPLFSVQYHPESSPGTHDSRYLFDDFIKMIKNNK